MSSRSLQILTKPFYSNAVIISQSGKLLSTISDHKADWYLKKGIATEVPPPEGYPRAIRLTFEPHPEEGPRTYSLNVSEDKCVLCGNIHSLTLHHVVPYVVRKHFPIKHKTKARQWCVLLCTDCHEEVEKATQPLYKQDFPLGIKDMNTNFTLQVIKYKNNLDRIPPEKLKELLSRSDYKTIDKIPDYSPKNKKMYFSQRSRQHKSEISAWANKFIAEHGGIEGVKSFFREIFLCFNPKFLPTGYLEIGDTRLTDEQKTV